MNYYHFLSTGSGGGCSVCLVILSVTWGIYLSSKFDASMQFILVYFAVLYMQGVMVLLVYMLVLFFGGFGSDRDARLAYIINLVGVISQLMWLGLLFCDNNSERTSRSHFYLVYVARNFCDLL